VHHAGALAIGGFVRSRWRGGRGPVISSLLLWVLNAERNLFPYVNAKVELSEERQVNRIEQCVVAAFEVSSSNLEALSRLIRWACLDCIFSEVQVRG
jgi:hypothetical protein